MKEGGKANSGIPSILVMVHQGTYYVSPYTPFLFQIYLVKLAKVHWEPVNSFIAEQILPACHLCEGIFFFHSDIFIVLIDSDGSVISAAMHSLVSLLQY